MWDRFIPGNEPDLVSMRWIELRQHPSPQPQLRPQVQNQVRAPFHLALPEATLTRFAAQPDRAGTPRAVIDPNRNFAVWTWDAKGEAFGNSPPNQAPCSLRSARGWLRFFDCGPT